MTYSHPKFGVPKIGVVKLLYLSFAVGVKSYSLDSENNIDG
jgi:hypothetical protein